MKVSVRRMLVPALFLCLALGAAATPLSAHRVNVFAYVESGVIHTESYAQDGDAVKGGVIEVYDSAGRLVHRGETDGGGMHRFPVPARDDLTIVLDASMGHRATFTLEADELGGTEPAGLDELGGTEPAASTRQADAATLEEIRAVVREEVSAQVAPLLRQVARNRQDRITVNEVFAGIGYILGLTGIALFVYSRKGSGAKR